VFPDGVTIRQPEVSDGYVVMAAAGKVKLVDLDGVVVHDWASPNGGIGITRPLDGGRLLMISGGSAVEVDWDGNVLFRFDPPAGLTFHHDVERLADGNTRILARRPVERPDISDTEVDDDTILEVTPSGEIVWEWHTVDHFEDFDFSPERLALIRADATNWSHANAIATIPADTPHTDPRFAPGNVIISYRAQNTVAIIDRPTGDIVWKSTDRTIGQHAAHMLTNDLEGAGNILVFDNGWNGQFAIPGRFYSRVVEIDPRNLSMPWTYDATKSGLPNWTFYSGIISAAQRLPGGNTLITEGTTGRVFEVTRAGKLVWEYVNDSIGPNNTRNVYRAYKVPASWADSRFTPDLLVRPDVPAAAPPGGLLRATFLIANAGDEPAIDPVATVEGEERAAFHSLVAPPDWNCTTPAVDDTGDVVCRAGRLRAGESASIDVVWRIDPCTSTGGQPIALEVSASGRGDDLDPSDNRATAETALTWAFEGQERMFRARPRCPDGRSPEPTTGR
jgi:hypothetical protein